MAAKSVFIMLCGALLAACANVAPPPAAQAPLPPLQSVEQADRRLEQVAVERAAIEAAYARAEQVCYARFFVNTCLDAAKEKRRSALASVRAIEVEAGHFKRQAAAEQRDRELAEADKEFQQQEAKRAAEPPKPVREATEPPPPRPLVAGSRAAAHEAKLKRLAAQEKAGAAKRAASVTAFEKKRLESEQRQREVAAKKAEKAAKDAAKEEPK